MKRFDKTINKIMKATIESLDEKENKSGTSRMKDKVIKTNPHVSNIKRHTKLMGEN